MPTESIVSSVDDETYKNLAAKDNIRSRIASTVQSASIPDNTLTKDDQRALKRLKNYNNIYYTTSRQRACHFCYAKKLTTLTKWADFLTTNKLTKNFKATPASTST